jgi:hypothetical protein
MSVLESEFFNLLETSESRWTTLLVEGRTWINFDAQNFAWQAKIDRMRANGARIGTFGPHIATSKRSDSNDNEAPGTDIAVEPVDHEETWSLWAAPERRRAKFEVGDDLVDVVIEGSTFWSNGHGRSITNGGKKNHGHGQGDGQNLIQTAEFAGLLHVVKMSECMRIGRHTIDAKVTILDDENPKRGQGLHGLTIGDAESLDLSVDRERGVVLIASSWFQGAIYRIVEMTNVVFDPNFAPDLFTIEPEFGKEWTST